MPAPAVSTTVTSGYQPAAAMVMGGPAGLAGGVPAPYAPIGVPDGVSVVVAPAEAAVEPQGVGLQTLLDWFNAYQDTKTDEMDEQRTARRYYHGVQWTDEERKILQDRRQPVLENNRIAPKIDGIVGVIIRLRQDPKAYPRNEAQAAGADIGNAAIREVLDAQAWESLHAQIAQDLAIDGLGGIEMDLEPSDDGSADQILRRVAPETFFYDPRSVKADFSDARFMGVYKWMDLDAAIEMMPDREEELTSAVENTTQSITQGLEDWDKLWYDTRLKRVKVAECWYRLRGDWRGAIYTGGGKLQDFVSPFKDDKNKTVCRYLMSSAGIDHLGNRYGFVRNMKSPQDEINHRRSKLLHIMNVNQVIYEDGAVDDIKDAMDQLAKPDGAVRVLPGQKRFEIRDQSPQMQGQAELLNEAKQSIEGFGPSPSLLGQASGDASGRALAMQQQAGIAQLGPYFMRYKDWKLRVYRALWAGVKDFWTTPRLIRVAGDDNIRFLPINQLVMTPTGPRIANAIGQLDLDVVMDEGPDVVTLQQDVMQAVTALITNKMLPPNVGLPVVVELSNLPPATKAKLLSAGQPQPDPQQQQLQQVGVQLKVQDAQAKIRKTNADADSAQADAVHKIAQAKNSGVLAQEHFVHTAGALADLEHKHAQIQETRARTDGAKMDALATLGGMMPPPPPPQAVPFGA